MQKSIVEEPNDNKKSDTSIFLYPFNNIICNPDRNQKECQIIPDKYFCF